MASNFAEKYLSKLPSGKSFPTGAPFLMPGLGVIKKAKPPQVEQVNQACALAFQDSLSQVVKMCPAQAKPKFMQLVFAQAFMVGTDLHCLCVIQWECQVAKKSAAKATSKGKPVAKGKPAAKTAPARSKSAAKTAPAKAAGKARPAAKPAQKTAGNGKAAGNGKPSKPSKPAAKPVAKQPKPKGKR